ncbi:AMIN domain-containing protein [Paenibacillus antri]|uniref:AMIN domain-containing protein n=1 Tax=Paenibacillus antri TaxID=2582848 RepID=A0A5R9GCC3_9BACL|nr:N-acetylmuramoyl-L-alanine amidase family protein [Paenibacillus antri]TLS50794.1 AMIN domain-containing protein [Paenibacillus antri]
MKHYSLAAIFFALIVLFAQPGHASAGVTTVYLDGQALVLPKNGQVQIVNDRVMIPIRVVAEGLGFYVVWEQTGKISISRGGTSLLLSVNEPTAFVNGAEVTLSAAPIVATDTTLVPIRFVSEQMGLLVDWSEAERAVYVTSPPESPPPPANTDLATVNGIRFGDDSLVIALDKRVTPHVFTLRGPNRLVVDLPQAMFAEALADVLPLDKQQSGSFDVADSANVTKIRYALFNVDPSTVRVVVDLRRSASYTLTDNGDGLLTVVLSEDPQAQDRKTIVIDPGHGGSDPGAISATKKPEKQFTLALGLKVEQLLKQEPGLEVVMTRKEDIALSLEERVRTARDANADLFVSIHGNSINPPANPSGTETYYTRSESLPLAEAMHRHLLAATGLPDRKVRQASLHVTRETRMPAVLLEIGYLSHATDESLMYTEIFQQRVAEGIVAGIKEYLSL